MRQQDIQKIIEQVEACSTELKKLSRVLSEVKEDASENKDIATVAEAMEYGTMVSTLRIGTDAQLDGIKALIAEINNK